MPIYDEIDFGNISPKDALAQVNEAIYAVLHGGQSYSIGSRSLTRADLSLLKTMKEELKAQLDAETTSGFLDGTYVAVFDGR